MIKQTILVLLILIARIAHADSMACTGSLKLMVKVPHQKEKVFRPDGTKTLKIAETDGVTFTVLDTNETELARVWPWKSVQYQELLSSKSMLDRHFKIYSNGVNSFSIKVDSRDHKGAEQTFCEIEEDLL